MKTNKNQKWILAGLVMTVVGGLVVGRVLKKGGVESGSSSTSEQTQNSEQAQGQVGADGSQIANEANGNASSRAGGVQHGGSAGVGIVGAGGKNASGSSSVNGAPGTPEMGAAASGTTEQVAKKPATGCESVTFASKQGHKYTQNLVKLTSASDAEHKPNLDTVCVRVDGLPVRYTLDKKKQELTFGTVRKADSRVTVSYCVGNAKCGEPCVVPRDEFMEALAGTDEEEDEGKGAGWANEGGPASKDEQELEKQLTGFNQVLSEERVKGVNPAWTLENRSDACEGRIAKK